MTERRFMWSLRDAIDGLGRSVREQRNLRIHLYIGAAAIALAAFLHFDALRWAVLCVTIGGVLVAELLNTALERAVDCASPGESEAARAAKHAAAAAVLTASIAAIAVGVWLFGSVLWQLWQR